MWLGGAAPLLRVRLAFVALGGSLVVLVIGLLHSATERLEAQRSLRHRTVAERVFDEVEREIGSVLQHEAERPSEAYDAADTDPSRWSPFVTGYYKRDPELEIVAADRLGAARAARVRQTVEALREPLAAARARLEAESGQRSGNVPAKPSASLDEPQARGVSSSPAVLRQLNRSVKVRERRMHEFLASFAVARSGPWLVAERNTQDRAEGLVIEVPRLVDTIQAWVLGSQGLRQLAALTPAKSGPRSPRLGRYLFVHRLAAPFDGYEVSLELARLDDEDASGTLFGFAALLTVAAVLGLLAISRMVEVQVGFAERRNNFVSAVTHELRTPLTAIRMYGEMLRDDMVPDESTRHEYYAIITAEGERLTRLINNVMEHGRLRRGQRFAHLERGDASALVREVVELMRPHIEREGFTVTLSIATALPSVRLDADALKQMLFNVLDNALKYGRGPAEPRIDVTCEAVAEGAVAVSVRDYGPGVNEAQIGSVFEPFCRGENELTRRQQGTGLGLALVRDLGELMHGSVQARNSEPGFELRIVLRAA